MKAYKNIGATGTRDTTYTAGTRDTTHTALGREREGKLRSSHLNY